MGACISVGVEDRQPISSRSVVPADSGTVKQAATLHSSGQQQGSSTRDPLAAAAGISSSTSRKSLNASAARRPVTPEGGAAVSGPQSGPPVVTSSARGGSVSSGEYGSNRAQARAFFFRDLRAATRGFPPEAKLGEGGYGSVYRGQLADGSVVAVKVLDSEGGQGEREWEAEVRFLGQVQHPNLVRLIGYCCEDVHRDLVYEFMPLGSLDSWLFSKSRPCLSWDVRMKVALHAARGLAFLHGQGIIFRDLKPSNVLLDEDYNAKLSDFGLARDGPRDNRTHVSTRVMGTQGYAAPEYIYTGHLTVKSDIYTYGMVLLEIVSGRRAVEPQRPKGEQNLATWSRPLLLDKARMTQAVDHRLGAHFSQRALRRVAVLALNCVRKEASARPSMAEVARLLEGLQGMHEQELRLQADPPMSAAAAVAGQRRH